jgi:ribosome biogenesis GTPase
MGLDGDFNVSRLERYLLLARESEVLPVVVLNKCDTVEDVGLYKSGVKQAVGDVPVHAVSALTGEGMETLLTYFKSKTTVVLLGSSGAGKSTITNWLLADNRQVVRGVRNDDSHGRHTTTARQLFLLPDGGHLIDTPGMRELGVYSTEEQEAEVFVLLDTLASQCRFSNCDHEKSTGCAILAAIESGKIESRQLQNYLKLQRERVH